MTEAVIKVASFADGTWGGNPAGVFIADHHPDVSQMQSIAASVGFSETAFAKPTDTGWRVRYFSPESEVPFCGHATIALGAVLAEKQGPGTFALQLNETEISVQGFNDNGRLSAALQSPATTSAPADPALLSRALALFGYVNTDLDTDIPPAFANAGANHLIVALNSRQALSSMHYDLDQGRQFMNDAGLVTVMLVYAENKRLFHSRNPFASGGVYEDPATGAASAAFAGYLRDLKWPHGGAIDIVQGEDMGSRSLIRAQFDDTPGASIRVSGAVRFL